MNRLTKFFHECFHPHCDECEKELICESCEILKVQLDMVNFEKRELIKLISTSPSPQIEREVNLDTDKPIQPRGHTPWNVRRQFLEAEDRKKAQLIKESELNRVKSIEELETELNINKG